MFPSPSLVEVGVRSSDTVDVTSDPAALRRRPVPGLLPSSVVVVALGLGGSIWPKIEVGHQGLVFAAATVLGLVLGLLWQLFWRRDLADRLIAPALLLIVGGFVPLILDQVEFTPAAMYALVTVTAGLIVAEQWHRRRETDVAPLSNENADAG